MKTLHRFDGKSPLPNFFKVGKIALFISMYLFVLFLASCSVEPQPINYGQDNCEFCKMTIMDPKFGAEVVTEKGMAFKFDAIECMFKYLHDHSIEKDAISLFLINTIDKPSELFDAKYATYLISQNVPSPMGAFLSGYINREHAIKVQSEKDGTIFNWDEINDLFHKKAHENAH